MKIKKRNYATLKTKVYEAQIEADDMNDNQKNNILMSENIRQKRITILEYFDAYICYHFHPKIIQ